MLHGHVVDNCNIIFHTKGRQFDLGESRSSTQIFQQNQLPASLQLGAYVCAFGLGLMEIMPMAMAMAMAIVLVIVIVIIVPAVLRQVGSLCHHQHQSFFRRRAYY